MKIFVPLSYKEYSEVLTWLSEKYACWGFGDEGGFYIRIEDKVSDEDMIYLKLRFRFV